MSRRFVTAAVAALLAAGCQDSTSLSEQYVTPSPNTVPAGEATATLTWNKIARDLVVKHGTGAIPAIRVFALVSVAQNDAIVAADQADTNPLHPSEAGAVAGASAAVLTYLFPTEATFLEATVAEQESAPVAPGNQNVDFASGEQVGRSVAARIVTRAQGDGFFAPFTGTVPVCAGCWLAVPTPPAFATLGQAKPFFLTSGDQFRPQAPPAFDSPEYAAALAEVRQIAQTRTAQQDSIAKFWALPVGTVGPMGYWNEVGADLILRYHLNERRAAHTLALMNAAGFDAIIASHEAKYTYWLIRPSQADPAIGLAIGLPSFPSYPSNHATISAAAATILGVVFPSEHATLDARADEAGISRLFGGIHYRFDVDAGLALGRRIGQYVVDSDDTKPGPLSLR